MQYLHVPLMSDHPRVGGEHTVTATRRSLSAGSSPRRRGTHPFSSIVIILLRIIPA